MNGQLVDRFTTSHMIDAIISGGSYGFIATLLSHPFDTIKTRQQVHAGYVNKSFIQAAMQSLRSEGIFGLYRGFLPTLIAALPVRSTPFIAYTFTSKHLEQYHPVFFSEHPNFVSVLAGASGGLLRTVLECPAEVFKVRRQLDLGAPAIYSLSASYIGMSITAMRNMGLVACFWVFYNQANRSIPSSYPIAKTFFIGAGASVMAWLVMYPLDVIKSLAQGGDTHLLMQATSTPDKRSQVDLRSAVAHIWNSKGWRGFYAGLGAGLARSALANGAGMLAYRWMHSQFPTSPP